MVVSFSLEPETASAMPSNDANWLSLNHKSSKLQSKITNRSNNNNILSFIILLFNKGENIYIYYAYQVSFSMSSMAASLFEETSNTRRLDKVERPSIFAIPLWLKYTSSKAIHSWKRYII